MADDTSAASISCYRCAGTGRVEVCAEHWWIPDTSGNGTRECGFCGAPERWVKEHAND